MTSTARDDHADLFTALRPLLFTIAYELLGSATEADDVLQDSYVRWAQVDPATVGDTKSYLAKIVARQALNALRATARRREDYVGPWLPDAQPGQAGRGVLAAGDQPLTGVAPTGLSELTGR